MAPLSSLSTCQAVAQAVAHAIASQDGELLASALTMDLGNSPLLEQLRQISERTLEQLCARAVDEPYDEMLLEHFRYLQHTHAGEFQEAYANQERACMAFQKVFEKDSAWSMPALHVLNLDLRRAAQKADGQAKERGEKPNKLQEAARTLQKSFQITVTDRAPLESSKKWGALHVINNLFKVYFQLNNLRLCQNLIRAVEGPGFPKALDGQSLDGRSFPVSQLVSYKYFVGRLSLLNSQFSRAERELNFSFVHAPRRSFKNKRLVLRYLVPVKIVLGSFPSIKLLEKYKLPYFIPICRAVHRGDLRAFEAELSAHQQLFIRHGSYLLVERAKIIVYRNFFKRVHELHPPATTKLDVKKFKQLLNVIGVEMEVDEIECVLANLIYNGYIKGYISHQHGKLVVSKGVAFPPLHELQSD
ncbi:hypothetical protein AB1Y20_017629 [Prymnesium parvum]|uniref:PCI domain-containing protein n=1 Tax=Prymnesium parvum TaxID=97485 RepID=A0AB34JL28_PRYPA